MSERPRADGDHILAWDPLVRLGHWLLVASLIASWWTRHGDHEAHERLGYVALVVVAIRVGWGFIAPGSAPG